MCYGLHRNRYLKEIAIANTVICEAAFLYNRQTRNIIIVFVYVYRDIHRTIYASIDSLNIDPNDCRQCLFVIGNKYI